MILNSPYISGSLTVTGNTNLMGALIVTGSLAGTATSSSFAFTASSAVSAYTAASAVNATTALTASYATSFTVGGTLTAQTLVVQTITSSVSFITGSTRFGSLLTNTHQFTGSVQITGSGPHYVFGNVGIGTSSPGYTAASRQVLAINGGSSAAQGSILAFMQGGVNKGYVFSIQNDMELWSESGDVYVGNNANASVIIKTQNTERLRINGSGSVGIGTTPSAWGTTFTRSAIQFGGSVGVGVLWTNSFNNGVFLGNNLYDDGAGNARYIINGTSTQYVQAGGEHYWSNAASGTAGNVATFTERMRITSSGSVGIGTTSPAVVFNVSDPNHGIGIAYRGSSALPAIAGLFTDTGVSGGGTGYGDLLVKARTDFGGFYGINFFTSAADNTPVLRMRVQSDGVLSLLSGQLKFPATQNASSDPNTLDDYEEGTFTPSLAIGGSSTGITYSVRRGDYTRVGRLVTIQLGIKMTSIGSNTGNLTITGLPFSVISDSYYHPYGVVGVVLNPSLLPLYALGAGSEVNFRKADTVSDVSPTNSDIDNDTYIFVTMTYSAA